VTEERVTTGRVKRPTVTYDGRTYRVRSVKTEIPDFTTMDRLAVLQWMSRYTTPRGYSRAPSRLQGLGIALDVR